MNDELRDQMMLSKWKSYIQGSNDLKGVKAEVAASWTRCRALGLDPFDRTPSINCRNLKKLLERNDRLLEMATPVIDFVHQFIQGTGFVIVLTDKNGIVLSIKGDNQVVIEAKKNYFDVGAARSETVVGTNAIGLSIIERRPIQTMGAEHFNIHHHYWACSAAPILDSDGKLIGVLDLSGHKDLNHGHTLGMVVSLVQVMEKELHLQEQKRKLKLANEHLKAVINSISDGVIALNRNGTITAANAKIQKLFHFDKSQLIGVRAKEVFGEKIPLLDVFETGKDYFEREDAFTVQHRMVPCITTARQIRNEKGQVVGVVGVLKEKQRMHNMINHFIGAKANFTFKDIIGKSIQLERSLSLAKTVSDTDTRVVLEGESGTGKELFAQSIHNASNRKSGPFIGVNCSAVPRELIESELFGYCEGAFTGARKGGKPGKFELANGGTLFLDEVGSMPLEMQAKLLRALQQNEIIRVGGIETIPVDIRIIAASNQPLDQMVAEGLFREDLFYRIGVVVIKIPSLRERTGDVPVLFSYLLNKICTKMGYEVNQVSNSLMDALNSYEWPGNVRQLENYVERAVVLAGGAMLTEEHFPKKVFENRTVRPSTAMIGLAQMEKETIEKALTMYKGNISQTAKKLGITRNTLYNKLREYDIIHQRNSKHLSS
ncbi:MAG: sigma-54-dependent Fis family transcriptional regulator [Dehalobacterium sp.]